MQLLLVLAAIAMVVYGALTASLPWVIAGALAVGVLSSGWLGTTTEEDVKRLDRLARATLGPPWRQLLVAALVCTFVAGWLSHRNPFDMISGYFWLASLALVVAAGLLHDRSIAAAPTPDSLVDSRVDGARSASEDSAPANAVQARWTLVDWAFALALAVAALALRLYQIGPELPPVHGDEGEMGMLALLALHGPASGIAPQRLPFFSTAFLDHPTLFHYMQAFGMLLFGENITGLRILSAVTGALCAPFVYAIGRAGWGRVSGLTAGWLIAVSHLHIHYSRIALNNIQTVLLVILLIWLLALAHEEPDAGETGAQRPRRLLLFVAIGLVTGLSQYFYYGSRLLPVLAVPLLLYLWHLKKVTVGQITVSAIAAIVAYFPLALYYAGDVRAFSDRLRGVSVFNAEGMAHTLGPQAAWPNDVGLLLWTQVKSNLAFFLNYGDRSSFYLADIPAFDKATVILFWLGLGMALAKVRRYHELALLAWFGLGVFLAGVVTTNAPHGPRLIVAVPAIFLIGGIFAQNMYSLFAKVWPTASRTAAMGAMAALAALTLYWNYNSYFTTYKQLRPNMGQISIAQEMAAAAAEGYRSYLLGAPNLYAHYGTLRFIAVGAEREDLESADQLLEILAEEPETKGALIIALPHRLADLQEIKQRFPHGTETVRKDGRGVLLYVAYRIPPEELD